ncbi:MAG: proton-conducting transporter membrane subunit, partial [Phycisphaeraceae bacterium]
LFNLFVHVEVAAISSYALVASGGRGAPRAALRYLIIGSLGASRYLLGVGFLYAATGSLNMADVSARLAEGWPEPRLVLVGSVLILVGLGVKMGLFPLHGWMPAAYSRAPIAASALMAPLMTKVAAYALIRVMFWVFGAAYLIDDRFILEVVLWAGAAAVMLGGVIAFVQTDIRRLLAYSSVSQVGLVAVGVGLANAQGMIGSFLHIANDALMKGALFLFAGVALLRFGVRNVEDLPKLRGQAPWTGLVVVIAGLSLVGIPPLAGFFGKWYVLMGSLAAERWVIAAAVVIGSIATVGYVFKILEKMYYAPVPELAEGVEPVREGPTGMVVASVVFAVGLIVLGLYNASVVDWVIIPAMPSE